MGTLSSMTTVFFKGSGELLAGKHGEKNDERHLWTPNGVRNTSEKIARAQQNAGRLGIDGLVVVSGAGNIIRGEALRAEGLADEYADFLGRLATLQNQIIIREALNRLDVPNVIFVAPGTLIEDPTAGRFSPYSAENIAQAHADGRVVLIAMGKGTDGNTTDEAVVFYAEDYLQSTPGSNVLVLKGTKHDGIFDQDPAKHGTAKRFRTITVAEMRRLSLGGARREVA